MNSGVQNLASLLNIGASLSAIGPADGLLAGIRLEDGYASLPVEMDRNASFSFANEMLDAASAIYRLGIAGPIAIGERLEADFPRLQFLTRYVDFWNGTPGHGERMRSLVIEEARELDSGGSVPHGDRFTLIASEKGLDPVSLCVGKFSRGFSHAVGQFRQIALTSPLSEKLEISELIVGGPAVFWAEMFPLAESRRSLWSDALMVASALYVEDPDRYHQGFEIRTRDRRSFVVRWDDRGLPYLPGGALLDVASLKPRSIRSVAQVRIGESLRRALKINVRNDSLVVRERRVGDDAGTAHSLLAEAGIECKRRIEKEMTEFYEADFELKQACLELARFLARKGPARLL